MFFSFFKKFFRRYQISNEEDLSEANKDHFVFFIEWIEGNAYAINKLTKEKVTYIDSQISLQEAIVELAKYIVKVNDPEEQEQWTALFREGFINWLKVSWPDGYEMRFKKVQL